MSLNKIAGRYAKSLLDLATENSLLDEIYEDMLSISNACKSKDLVLLLKSPIIKADKKIQVFNAIFSNKINALTQAFLNLLTQKGRESIMPEISSAFIEQFKTVKKIRSAKLISAGTLSEAEVNSIKNKYSSWLKAGETIELTQVVDPGIIGGYIFQMEGRQEDATIKRNLESMKIGLYDSSYTNLVIKA
ncbi:MAG: ATP synthase F1 subunit delta [Saprospiraceae bacterium]